MKRLSEQRLLNTTITRSKRHFCVVGDLQIMTDSGHTFLKERGKFAETELKKHDWLKPYKSIGVSLSGILETGRD